MATRAEATAAPVELNVKGKTYYLTPMADESWGEFEQWLQDRIFNIAKRNLKGLDGADRQSLLRSSLDKAIRIRFSDPEAVEVMGTYEGAVELTYLAMRPRHPDITKEEVSKLLFDPDVLAEAMDKVPLGMPSDVELGSKKKRPVRTAKRRKRKADRTAKKPKSR